MGAWFRRVLVLALLVAAGTAGALSWLVFSWAEAPGPLDESRIVVVSKGLGTAGIARELTESGVVENRTAFALLARLTEGAGNLRAGEYALAAHVSPEAVLALLRSGETVVHRLVVPEGLTSAEIVASLEAAPALQGHISGTPSEGALLPETYFYSWGDTRGAVLGRMRTNMSETLAALWAKRAGSLPIDTPEAAVTLASIVEKETALAAERPKIAGVFYNRLRHDMKFQSDPTVIYAITGGAGSLGRPLVHADLDVASPYNTYRVAGLPPGPIANPGRASLEAVLHPEPTQALYFVADGTGGHAFAATLEAHNQNVVRLRNQVAATPKQTP